MNRVEVIDRMANLRRQAREEAGKSQDYMAKALGVSKKTIQNWEDGSSIPNELMNWEWYEALDKQPLTYLLQAYYPIYFQETDSEDDERIWQAMLVFLRQCGPHVWRELMFWAFAKHGSDPLSVLEMITCYLKTPLVTRPNIAASILNNYDMAVSLGQTIPDAQVEPNIDLFEYAIKQAKEAVKQKKNSYTVLEKEKK